MPAPLTRAPRDVEIAQLDATSRTRALTDRESERLADLLYRERYLQLRLAREAA